MSEKDDGGPGPQVKFPEVTPVDGWSMRDWFAGQALVGTLAFPIPGDEKHPAKCARYCYEYADAMLLARSHQEDKQ